MRLRVGDSVVEKGDANPVLVGRVMSVQGRQVVVRYPRGKFVPCVEDDLRVLSEEMVKEANERSRRALDRERAAAFEERPVDPSRRIPKKLYSGNGYANLKSRPFTCPFCGEEWMWPPSVHRYIPIYDELSPSTGVDNQEFREKGWLASTVCGGCFKSNWFCVDTARIKEWDQSLGEWVRTDPPLVDFGPGDDPEDEV